LDYVARITVVWLLTALTMGCFDEEGVRVRAWSRPKFRRLLFH
jgi:hypothetical protein